MSSHEDMKQILVLLSENLEFPKPELVSSNTLARTLQVEVDDIKTALKSLEGRGYIQVDPDLQNSLITRAGLSWLLKRGVDINTYDFAAEV